MGRPWGAVLGSKEGPPTQGGGAGSAGAVGAWAADAQRRAPRRLFPIWRSVPPEPHPTLVAESYELENNPGRTVMIERQLFTGADLLKEHEDDALWQRGREDERAREVPIVFRAFRRRLLRQMERRKWTAALTDFTIVQLFCSQPPAAFVSAMKRLLGDLDGALVSSGLDTPHVNGQPSVSSLYRDGFIKLIFKGGNPQALMKLRCLDLLPQCVRKILEIIRPFSLSDIDMMLALDCEACCLRDACEFERIHRQCTVAVEQALHRLVLDVRGCLGRGCSLPPWQQRSGRRHERGSTPTVPCRNGAEVLASFLNNAGTTRAATIGRASAQVNETARELRAGLERAMRVYGHCPQDVLSQLNASQNACARPCERRSRHITQDASGRCIELSCYGPPSKLFVSSSPHVEFRDVRCTADTDRCKFGLVRLFLGFRLDFMLPGSSRVAERRYSRGEIFDVSIPKQDDVSLMIMCEHEKQNPGSTMTWATLSSSELAVRLHVMTLDALIDENYDLTFGRGNSMDDPCIWRIPKVQKRLVRLMELLGIKLLTLEGHSWSAKSKACASLASTMEDFCTTGALSEASSGPCKVCADSRIEGCLLRGFRIFANALRREKDSLPVDARMRIYETVRPVVRLAAAFAAACNALSSSSARDDMHLNEGELYRWTLGDTWHFREGKEEPVEEFVEEAPGAMAASTTAEACNRFNWCGGSSDIAAVDTDSDVYSGADWSFSDPDEASPAPHKEQQQQQRQAVLANDTQSLHRTLVGCTASGSTKQNTPSAMRRFPSSSSCSCSDLHQHRTRPAKKRPRHGRCDKLHCGSPPRSGRSRSSLSSRASCGCSWSTEAP